MKHTGQTSASASTANVFLSYGERLHAAANAGYPMLEAAQPLLQALRETPAKLGADAVLERRQRLLDEARMFERVCSGLQLPRTEADHARYCLCSALDEAAMQTSWGKGALTGTEWSANGLAATLGYDRQGGDRVFALLDKAMQYPAAHGELLAVLHEIIGSGFMGRYRHTPDGAHTLKAIHKDLAWLVFAMQKVSHITGQDSPRGTGAVRRLVEDDDAFLGMAYRIASYRSGLAYLSGQRRQVRIAWVLVGLLAFALLAGGGYVLYRLHEEQAARTHPAAFPAIAMAIRNSLPQEIAAHTVTLDEPDDHSRLTIRVDGMFAPGKYVLDPASVPALVQIGQAIMSAGPNVLVHLAGYTDDTRFENAAGLSNQSLSALRAQAVMQVLANAGVSPGRITITGNGESSPLDDNRTREGRARNRRVEIAVEPLR
ncbi:type IVB secretion system protein IcmH/DotU [Paraburkholderia lycopersici]|uniref:Type VI secretion system protein ImpK n=1 Tax=Paraburkholderia lycopersici TaxID=416944 RepID=A0A1G6SK38_9BURK|nr:type IVB secretion system protein IcmH/DotU [Paraburkholderia lycopersici]SDD16495.1 type VI secretion system protein ImpK [Paraburkholderia lycopersici]